jgi:response regulator RpfG family c-di-GMP phosphodiesterase
MKNQIFVVDDETKDTELVGRFLKMKGFYVTTANDGASALEKAEKIIPDVALLDIRMPGMSGIELLKEFKKRYPETEVIMATAVGEVEIAVACMQAGAFGYLNKPLDLEMVHAEVVKAFEHRDLVLKLKDYKANLEQKVEERTQEITNLNVRLKDNFLKSIRMLITLIERYDPYLGGHMRRVAQLSGETAKMLNLQQKDLLDLEMASLLHDLGIVSLPKRLMEASFKDMTVEEIRLIKQHPIFAQDIVSPMSELDNAGLIIRHHLERIDGTGFPDGLTEEKIPYGSKILGVVNAFDEIVSRRRFTLDKLDTEEEREEFAFKILFDLSGKYYSRIIVDAVKKAVYNLDMKSGHMVKVALKDLKPGMIVARSIKTGNGTLLLAKGFPIEKGIIKQIKTLYEMDLIADNFQIIDNTPPTNVSKSNETTKAG